MTDSTYAPGVYRNGDRVRIAETASDAVAASFDGFVLDTDGATESDTVENGNAPEVGDDATSSDDGAGASGGAATLFS